ncbi:AAC(3) family N-acetyltransferase [Schlesneria sp. T3-172]|uniref:AAC(3) family N-acetyltransferase n=1 Tax=Schlesneria sphaerica TaxID=3373610 RepID=UPI0037C7BB14
MVNEAMCHTAVPNRGLASEAAARSAAPKLFSGPADAFQVFAEWSARQIYWRSPWLRDQIKRWKTKSQPAVQFASRADLSDYLTSIGVIPGSLVMAHTSVSGLSFESTAGAANSIQNSFQVAQELVSLLKELVGPAGTLVMPTHPIYKAQAASQARTGAPPVYNPKTTPCGVGLANEVFWRQAGTQRSLFPHNTLAACGPLADELLRDNLTEHKSLPHGEDSGYYRFCQRDGLLISVGVPLASCFTLVHVAEESRDAHWPVKNFFEEREYVVRSQGVDRTVTIRKTRSDFMKFSFCLRKLRRDLLREGVLHEGKVGSVRVDWASSAEMIDFISRRNQNSTYPYFGTGFVPRPAP